MFYVTAAVQQNHLHGRVCITDLTELCANKHQSPTISPKMKIFSHVFIYASTMTFWQISHTLNYLNAIALNKQDIYI